MEKLKERRPQFPKPEFTTDKNGNLAPANPTAEALCLKTRASTLIEPPDYTICNHKRYQGEKQ
ncbi:hypothetical protein CMI48_04490 [Candidatus Pacearchaeota archaeon]|nr:hypothetical protein [Candidatus Pacearchaeota archaeon]